MAIKRYLEGNETRDIPFFMEFVRKATVTT
jgi:hypothetical protein